MQGDVTIGPISQVERAERARRAFDFVDASGDTSLAEVAALVLFDDQFIQYYTDFVFHPTERPVALIITRGGHRTLFVPDLEREHAAQAGQQEQVVTYPEYPGLEHPLELLCRQLAALGVARHPISVDHDGYPPVMGYRGPLLSERLTIRRVTAALDRQLSLKSAAGGITLTRCCRATRNPARPRPKSKGGRPARRPRRCGQRSGRIFVAVTAG